MENAPHHFCLLDLLLTRFHSRLGKDLSTMLVALLFAAGLFIAIVAGFAKVEDSAY